MFLQDPTNKSLCQIKQMSSVISNYKTFNRAPKGYIFVPRSLIINKSFQCQCCFFDSHKLDRCIRQSIKGFLFCNAHIHSSQILNDEKKICYYVGNNVLTHKKKVIHISKMPDIIHDYIDCVYKCQMDMINLSMSQELLLSVFPCNGQMMESVWHFLGYQNIILNFMKHKMRDLHQNAISKSIEMKKEDVVVIMKTVSFKARYLFDKYKFLQTYMLKCKQFYKKDNILEAKEWFDIANRRQELALHENKLPENWEIIFWDSE